MASTAHRAEGFWTSSSLCRVSSNITPLELREWELEIGDINREIGAQCLIIYCHPYCIFILEGVGPSIHKLRKWITTNLKSLTEFKLIHEREQSAFCWTNEYCCAIDIEHVTSVPLPIRGLFASLCRYSTYASILLKSVQEKVRSSSPQSGLLSWRADYTEEVVLLAVKCPVLLEEFCANPEVLRQVNRCITVFLGVCSDIVRSSNGEVLYLTDGNILVSSFPKGAEHLVFTCCIKLLTAIAQVREVGRMGRRPFSALRFMHPVCSVDTATLTIREFGTRHVGVGRWGDDVVLDGITKATQRRLCVVVSRLSSEAYFGSRLEGQIPYRLVPMNTFYSLMTEHQPFPVTLESEIKHFKVYEDDEIFRNGQEYTDIGFLDEHIELWTEEFRRIKRVLRRPGEVAWFEGGDPLPFSKLTTTLAKQDMKVTLTPEPLIVQKKHYHSLCWAVEVSGDATHACGALLEGQYRTIYDKGVILRVTGLYTCAFAIITCEGEHAGVEELCAHFWRESAVCGAQAWHIVYSNHDSAPVFEAEYSWASVREVSLVRTMDDEESLQLQANAQSLMSKLDIHVGLKFREERYRDPITGVSKRGIKVSKVKTRPLSMQDGEGFQIDDVILEIDTTALMNLPQLMSELYKRNIGQYVRVRVLRNDKVLAFWLRIGTQMSINDFAIVKRVAEGERYFTDQSQMRKIHHNPKGRAVWDIVPCLDLEGAPPAEFYPPPAIQPLASPELPDLIDLMVTLAGSVQRRLPHHVSFELLSASLTGATRSCTPATALATHESFDVSKHYARIDGPSTPGASRPVSRVSTRKIHSRPVSRADPRTDLRNVPILRQGIFEKIPSTMETVEFWGFENASKSSVKELIVLTCLLVTTDTDSGTLTLYSDIVLAALSCHNGKLQTTHSEAITAYFDPPSALDAIQAAVDIAYRFAILRSIYGNRFIAVCGLARGTCSVGVVGGARQSFGAHVLVGSAVSSSREVAEAARAMCCAVALTEEVREGLGWPGECAMDWLASLGLHACSGAQIQLYSFTEECVGRMIVRGDDSEDVPLSSVIHISVDQPSLLPLAVECSRELNSISLRSLIHSLPQSEPSSILSLSLSSLRLDLDQDLEVSIDEWDPSPKTPLLACKLDDSVGSRAVPVPLAHAPGSTFSVRRSTKLMRLELKQNQQDRESISPISRPGTAFLEPLSPSRGAPFPRFSTYDDFAHREIMGLSESRQKSVASVTSGEPSTGYHGPEKRYSRQSFSTSKAFEHGMAAPIPQTKLAQLITSKIDYVSLYRDTCKQFGCRMNKTVRSKLAVCQDENDKIVNLDVAGAIIGPKGFSALAAVVPLMQGLRAINASNNNLNNTNVNDLCHVCMACPLIAELDISGNPDIYDDETLRRMVHICPGLESIKILDCGIQDPERRSLEAVCRSKQSGGVGFAKLIPV